MAVRHLFIGIVLQILLQSDGKSSNFLLYFPVTCAFFLLTVDTKKLFYFFIKNNDAESLVEVRLMFN